jgi:hypothetical protein
MKLYNIRPPQQFTWRGLTYTVLRHEGSMVEVETQGRLYAWPSSSNVRYIYPTTP